MTLHEFMPIYEAKHTKQGTRVFHLVGLLLAYFVVIAALTTGQYWYLAAAPMLGYGLAFSGHFWVEHNTPASFQHPLLSFVCDHIMAGKMVVGALTDLWDQLEPFS